MSRPPLLPHRLSNTTFPRDLPHCGFEGSAQKDDPVGKVNGARVRLEGKRRQGAKAMFLRSTMQRQ